MSDPLSLPTDVNHLVGSTATVLARPAVSPGRIAKTVRGQVGTFADFTGEEVRGSSGRLLLKSDKGTFRIKVGKWAAQTFASTAVTTSADTATITAHGLLTGQGPFRLTTSGGLPAGLATGTSYWLIAVDADTIKFATTRANAYAGTAIDLTTQGTGTHTLTGVWGLAATPAASVTDGGGGWGLAVGESIELSSVEQVTALGDAADSVLTYAWLR